MKRVIWMPQPDVSLEDKSGVESTLDRGTSHIESVSLRAQLEHGLKEVVYNLFSWVRNQPERDLDGLIEKIDHLFVHSGGSL